MNEYKLSASLEGHDDDVGGEGPMTGFPIQRKPFCHILTDLGPRRRLPSSQLRPLGL